MTTFSILIADWSTGSGLGVTLDTLSLANQYAAQLDRPQVKWKLFGASPEVPLSNGLSVSVNTLTSRSRIQSDVLIVSGLGLDHPSIRKSSSNIDDRYSDHSILKRMEHPDIKLLTDAARRHYASGGLACASCSGVLLLGEAGILTGRVVTTNWRLGRFLEKHYDIAHLDINKMLVEDERVITAAAAMAQMDLTLRLISMTMGTDIANKTMSGMLIESRSSQARYMVWNHLKTNDALVSRFESLIESNLEYPIPIAEMAKMLNVTEKTLARKVNLATGQSPKMFLQTIRMRYVQNMLDTTNLPLEEIATKVGFLSTNSLRKLTGKLANLSPGAMRKSDIHQGSALELKSDYLTG